MRGTMEQPLDIDQRVPTRARKNFDPRTKAILAVAARFWHDSAPEYAQQLVSDLEKANPGIENARVVALCTVFKAFASRHEHAFYINQVATVFSMTGLLPEVHEFMGQLGRRFTRSYQ